MSDTLVRALITVGGSTEVSILVKATIIMLAGLGATQLAARSRASMRHVLLASTFVALLLLPAALLLVPAAPIPFAVNRPSSSVTFLTSGRTPRSSTSVVNGTASQQLSGGRAIESMPKLSTVVRFGWATGFALLAAALGVSLWRLNRIRRLAYPWPERHALVNAVAGELGLRKRVALALHEDLGAPITCGTRRPAVILPSDARHGAMRTYGARSSMKWSTCDGTTGRCSSSPGEPARCIGFTACLEVMAGVLSRSRACVRRRCAGQRGPH